MRKPMWINFRISYSLHRAKYVMEITVSRCISKPNFTRYMFICSQRLVDNVGICVSSSYSQPRSSSTVCLRSTIWDVGDMSMLQWHLFLINNVKKYVSQGRIIDFPLCNQRDRSTAQVALFSHEPSWVMNRNSDLCRFESVKKFRWNSSNSARMELTCCSKTQL